MINYEYLQNISTHIAIKGVYQNILLVLKILELRTVTKGLKNVTCYTQNMHTPTPYPHSNMKTDFKVLD